MRLQASAPGPIATTAAILTDASRGPGVYSAHCRGDQREQQKPRAEAAAVLADEPEQHRQAEAADAANRTDDARDAADLVPETQRHELEDGAVAETAAGHRHDHQRRERAERRTAGDEGVRRGEAGERHGQEPAAADVVREPAADRTRAASDERRDRGEQSGARRRQSLLIAQEERQETAQTDVSAERHAVEETEPPEIRLTQHLAHRPRAPSGTRGRFACEEQECREHERERQHREAEDTMPADVRGEPRRDQVRDDGAAVPRRGDAHHETLPFGRIPGARERQRHRERRARGSEHEADRRHRRPRARAEPANRQRHEQEAQHHGPDAARAPSIAQEPERDSQQRSAQDRQRHEHPAFARRELQILGNQNAESADEHPQHEAEVEVEEARDERREMAPTFVMVIDWLWTSWIHEFGIEVWAPARRDHSRASAWSSGASFG